MGDVMTNKDLFVCKIAMFGVAKALGKLNGALGQFADILLPTCEEKYDKDRLFNSQLDYCFNVAKESGDYDASRNPKLQMALLDLVELTAVKFDYAQKRAFTIAYLQDANTSEWMPYKWKQIPKKTE